MHENQIDYGSQLPPINTYEDAVSVYDGIDRQSEAAFRMISSLPGIDPEALEKAVTATVIGNGATFGEQVAFIKQYTSKRLDDTGLANAQDAFTELDAAVRASDHLDRTAIAICQAAVTAKEGHLTRNIDWDRVVDTFTNQHPAYNDVPTKRVLTSLANPPGPSVTAIELIERVTYLEASYERLASEGMERTNPSISEPETVRVHGNMVRVLRSWEHSNNIATSMTSPERAKKLQEAQKVTSKEISKLVELSIAAGLGDNEDAVAIGIPKVIIQAIERRANQTITRYDETDHRIRQEFNEPVPRPNALFIKNPGLLDAVIGKEDSKDPQFANQWIADQLALFPPNLRHGLGRVIVTGDTLTKVADNSDWSEREAPDDPPELLAETTAGDFIPNRNTMRLNLGRPIKLANESYPDDPTMRHSSLVSSLEELFAHEYMHKVHLYELPVSWLRAWVDAVDSEPVEITEYVTQKRIQAHAATTDEAREVATSERYNEELCDSTSRFLHAPALLFQQAPWHFRMINTLFNEYTQETLGFMEFIRTSDTVSDEDRLGILITITARDRIRNSERHRTPRRDNKTTESGLEVV